MEFGGNETGLDALLRRSEQESIRRRLLRSPVTVIAELIYRHFSLRAERSHINEQPVRVVCISDTHNTQPALPDGDILIHAGDLTQSGTRAELEAQIEWLHSQPHRFKVVIAGNHELCLDQKQLTERSIDWRSLHYLENSSVTLDLGCRRLKVFGSPYTPKHGNWVFQYARAENIWDDISIPANLDILVTHGPPRTHLDLGRFGCQFLREWLWSAQRKPCLHVFGHVHGGYGKETVAWDGLQRAYEGVMDGKVKYTNLVSLGYHALLRVVGIVNPTQRTVFVNAAAVGGVRDEKQRGAISVDI
ncbi:hypothetical protein ASPZODRAFT_128977 [Penicilliopsis zonata CBS 506.65]|uniref:Calcineurin-like phosphoesterase domain-containing protein n=1 Tax=Penicilliopsis zonata CBS 506.65 TaxID=1073090 RepID=A0A1L9STC0_9EURO|nr:hypothetical protein ASPZODRAFT_128977 [Penicilliopsis zonata CBS 506.65]OJJ50361.1 hypothetical protein ASPZODRAFT_128977 [Penicilliopsis zonata CBS 506.65]